MLRWLPATAVLCVGLLGLRAAEADRTVHAEQFDVDLPEAFRPTSAEAARQACSPLRELLGALGAEAMGARKASCYLVGAPADPEASFAVRGFALRNDRDDVLGSASDVALAEGWKRFTTERRFHTAMPPRRRTLGGRVCIELGGQDPNHGALRLSRYLLLYQRESVLVVGFTTTVPDVKTGEAQWEETLGRVRFEEPSAASPLLQGLLLGVAVGAALMALLLHLLAKRRSRLREHVGRWATDPVAAAYAAGRAAEPAVRKGGSKPKSGSRPKAGTPAASARP